MEILIVKKFMKHILRKDDDVREAVTGTLFLFYLFLFSFLIIIYFSFLNNKLITFLKTNVFLN